MGNTLGVCDEVSVVAVDRKQLAVRFTANKIRSVVVFPNSRVTVYIVDETRRRRIATTISRPTRFEFKKDYPTHVAVWTRAPEGRSVGMLVGANARSDLHHVRDSKTVLAGLAIPETIRRAIETAW